MKIDPVPLKSPIKLPAITELKKANPAFFKSFYSSPVAKALISIQTNKYIEVNDRFLKLFECKSKQVIGFSADELNLWASPVQRKIILKEYKKKKINTFNFDVKSLKGNVKNVIISTENIEINGENFLLGAILDNTEKFTYENKLKESEEQYKFLYYKNPLPMWVFDYDTLKFISVNDSAIKHYGYSHDEFLKMKLTEIFPKEEVLKYLHYRENVISGNKRNNLANAGIWKHKKKSGEIIDVEITRTLLEFEGKKAILILANDITSVIDSQIKLQKKNYEMTLLYRSAKEISSTLDPVKIYGKIYKIVSKLIPCNGMMISSYDNQSEVIKCNAAWLNLTKLDVSVFPELHLDKTGGGIQSNVILSGKSIIVNNFDEYARNNNSLVFIYKDNSIKKKLKKADKINRSALVVPIILNRSVIGVFQVLSYFKNAYKQEHLQLLEAFSAELSTAISNARLFEQSQNEIKVRHIAEKALKDKTEELQILYEAQQVLSGSLDIESIYDKTYKIISSNIQCDSMIISSYDPGEQMIKLLSVWADGVKPDINMFPLIPLAPKGHGIQSEVIRSGKSLLIKDYPKFYRNTKTKLSYTNDKVVKTKKIMYNSALIAPMVHDNKIIGVIQLLSYTKNAYNDLNLKLLESLAGPVTAATYNASLYKQAQTEIEEKQKAREKLSRLNKEITLLYNAGRDLLSTLDLEEIYEIFYKKVTGDIPCDSMIISEYDRKNEKIFCKSAWVDRTKHNPKNFPPLSIGPNHKGTQAEAIITGNSIIVNNFYDLIKDRKDKILLDDKGNIFNNNVPEGFINDDTQISRSALYIPMKLGKNVIGVISVFSFKANAYNEYHLRILESISVNLSVAAANAELYKRANIEIEERIKKEEELKQIRKNLEEAQRISHLGSWVFDKKTDKIKNSEEVYRILGVKPINQWIDFENAVNYIYENDKDNTINVIKNAMLKNESYVNEDRVQRPNGEIRYVKVVGEPVLDKSGLLIGMQGSIQDITDVKRINDELVKSLSDKELLLKEIHHRVKNNLQIVSSLLRLQAEKIKDDTVLEHFKMSEQRIKSMALIHQQLYRAKDFSNINFRDYLNELCSYLLFANDNNQGKILLNIEAEELYFGIDTALPCGLIINELFTNAVKHAFPDGRKGNILLKLYKDVKNICYIEINDNGIGASKLDLKKSTSLGMELVNTLTDQLEGELSITVDCGTKIKLSFCELAHKNNN